MFCSITYQWILIILVSFYSDRCKQFVSHLSVSGFIALAAGLSVGMGGLAAGYAIGIVGDYVSLVRSRCKACIDVCLQCVRGYVRESRLFVTMVLILIFAEVLGLYGLIVALILNAKADNGACSA